ncbi:HAD family phosphatase [Clostridium malenominatum]|uniref:HAD family phosphatase n=1 Tax=Clostridium malenominatum TaxID=1539 RepID=A0ABP3UBK6_9CLOT
MIKNIIFDLGNVLLSFKPLEYLSGKISDKDKIEEIYKEIFLSEEWVMLDRGVITEEEAVSRICSRSLENSDLIKLCMENWYEILTPKKEMVQVLKNVKSKGYKTYILSNFHLLAYEDVVKRYDFFQYFDGGLISYEEKLLKPELEVYSKLIEKYKINPKESIFIDDTECNIEAAKKFGFEAILFDNMKNLTEKLALYGIVHEVFR